MDSGVGRMKRYRILLCMTFIGMLMFADGRNQLKAKAAEERRITAVELPQNLNFYLDPENKNGRGQIYSEKHIIKNAGKEAINFSIDMTLFLSDAQLPIMFCPKEWDEEPLDRSVYMYAVFEQGQMSEKYVLTDAKASERKTVVLEPAGEEGDTLFISFEGMLSKSEEWKSGELWIDALYAMSSKESICQAGVEGENIRLEKGSGEFEAGESAEMYLVPEEGYFLPGKIMVYMGGQEAEFIYDRSSGRVFLKKVTDDIAICANGIKKAEPPSEKIIKMNEKIWSWSADEGIQAYEYAFLQENKVIDEGRIPVEDGLVFWDWSQALLDGDYSLRLMAVGDDVQCFNSEEGIYEVRLRKESLQPLENEEK